MQFSRDIKAAKPNIPLLSTSPILSKERKESGKKDTISKLCSLTNKEMKKKQKNLRLN